MLKLKESGYSPLSSPSPLAVSLQVCRLKKMHNLKVENYVLYNGLTDDLNQRDSFSDSSEGLFRRGKGGARYIEVFAKKKKTNQVVRTSKDYC